MDKAGESWALTLLKSKAVLHPVNLKKHRTKLELIRWFNNRKNKLAEEVAYSEKSLSSIKRDRILMEIVERLLDAEKQNPPSRA